MEFPPAGEGRVQEESTPCKEYRGRKGPVGGVGGGQHVAWCGGSLGWVCAGKGDDSRR